MDIFFAQWSAIFIMMLFLRLIRMKYIIWLSEIINKHNYNKIDKRYYIPAIRIKYYILNKRVSKEWNCRESFKELK